MSDQETEEQHRIWAAEAMGWTYVPAGSLIEKPLKWMKLVCGYCHGVLTVTERYQWHKHEWATGSGEADCYGGKWKLFNSVWLKDGQVNSSLPDPEHNRADALSLVEAAVNDGWDILMETTGAAPRWFVNFWRYEMDLTQIIHTATDPDFCRAVTLAFLKLHGRL